MDKTTQNRLGCLLKEADALHEIFVCYPSYTGEQFAELVREYRFELMKKGMDKEEARTIATSYYWPDLNARDRLHAAYNTCVHEISQIEQIEARNRFRLELMRIYK